MEGRCKFIEKVVSDSLQNGPSARGMGGGGVLPTPHRKRTITLRNVRQRIDSCEQCYTSPCSI